MHDQTNNNKRQILTSKPTTELTLVILSLSCSAVRMYSRSDSAWSSGIPVESIMASREMSRAPCSRSTRNACSKGVYKIQ